VLYIFKIVYFLTFLKIVLLIETIICKNVANLVVFEIPTDSVLVYGDVSIGKKFQASQRGLLPASPLPMQSK